MPRLTTDQRERLARTVHAADAESYVTRIATALDPVVAELMAQVWDEGYLWHGRDCIRVGNPTPNPYRADVSGQDDPTPGK